MGYTVQDLILDNRLKINIDTNLWWLKLLNNFFCKIQKTATFWKYRNLGNLNSHVVGTSCNYPCVLVDIILMYKYIISYVQIHIFLSTSTYLFLYTRSYILMYNIYIYSYAQVHTSVWTSTISLCKSKYILCKSTYILMYKYNIRMKKWINPYVKVPISLRTTAYLYVQVHKSY